MSGIDSLDKSDRAYSTRREMASNLQLVNSDLSSLGKGLRMAMVVLADVGKLMVSDPDLVEKRNDPNVDIVKLVGLPLLEHTESCSHASSSLKAAFDRLIEARAHIAVATNALKLPADIAARYEKELS